MFYSEMRDMLSPLLHHTIVTRVRQRYKKNKRDLPWRHTPDPYAIHISETMLQQTQVTRVIPKYHAFLDRFPTYEALAVAPKNELLLYRSGLGFNSRALRLQQAAQQIVAAHDGQLPSDAAQLRALPGVGPYTAGAILAFAYNKDTVVVDINIKRVHIVLLQLDRTISDTELADYVAWLQPSGYAKERYSALMDIGSSIITAKKTGIRSSPQSPFAGSRRQARGRLLKYLTRTAMIARSDLYDVMQHDDAQTIVDDMIAEGFLFDDGGVVSIAG